MSRETEDYLTPDQMDAIVASVEAVAKKEQERVQFLLMQAIKWLDDGQWIKNHPFIWKRSHDGQRMTYYVSVDRLNFAYAGSKERHANYPNAFRRLFDIRYNTTEGFQPNILPKPNIQRGISSGIKKAIPHLIPSLLNGKEQRWNANIPPSRETLEHMVKWDDYNNILRVFNANREESEYVFDLFVELPDGETYAVWRIFSMLHFNNPDGRATKEQWKEVLAAHPEDTTPLIPPSYTGGIRRRRRYPVVTLTKPIDKEAPVKEQRFEAMVAASKSAKQMEIADRIAVREEKTKARQHTYYLKRKAEQTGMTKKEKEADNLARAKAYEVRALALLRDKKIAEETERDTHRQGKTRYE